MSKSQGPAGDYINAKISPALGTAALNRTEEEDLRREEAEPGTELAEAQRQLRCKTNVLPTAMSNGGTSTIKQPDPMVKIKTSQPMQGKSAEPPQGAVTDTLAPTLALADAWAKMEAAQLALDTLDARYSDRAGVMPWCEHFEGIGDNIRYGEDPEQNCQTLYDKVVAKAQDEFELLRLELQILIKKSRNKHINTARARYNLGRALWLSNKPLDTTQAVEEFDAAILFMTQREPNHHSTVKSETWLWKS